jgi:hypothetical protein
LKKNKVVKVWWNFCEEEQGERVLRLNSHASARVKKHHHRQVVTS